MEIPELPDNPGGSTDPGSGTRYRLQFVSTFVTLGVAITAIGLSVWQGYETRLHNRLSVQPYLNVSTTRLSKDTTYALRIRLLSSGLGPAVIEKILVYARGAPEDASPLATTSRGGDLIGIRTVDSSTGLESLPYEVPSISGSIEQGDMIRPGDQRDFFQSRVLKSNVPDSVDGYVPGQIYERLARHSYVVCYCSVYGDNCGQVHLLAAPPGREICKTYID